jgi:ATP synthase protein I
MFMLMHRTSAIQLGLVLITALVAYFIGGIADAMAALYGGAVAMTNSVLLYWRWRQGSKKYHCDAGRHLRSFYRSSLERLFVVGLLLALGFRLLELDPRSLLTGFVIGLFAWILASTALRERT